MNYKLILAVLVGLACLAQVESSFLDTIKDKVGDVKDSVVGTDSGDEKESKTYQGGIAKQVAHTVVDAAMERLEEEVKDRTDSKVGDIAVGLAASKLKKTIHSKINAMGQDGAKEEEAENKEEENKEGEEVKKDEKDGEGGVLGNLLGKISRKKRSLGDRKSDHQRGSIGGIWSKIKSKITGKKPSVVPAPVNAAITKKSIPVPTQSEPAKPVTTPKPIETTPSVEHSVAPETTPQPKDQTEASTTEENQVEDEEKQSTKSEEVIDEKDQADESNKDHDDDSSNESDQSEETAKKALDDDNDDQKEDADKEEGKEGEKGADAEHSEDSHDDHVKHDRKSD